MTPRPRPPSGRGGGRPASGQPGGPRGGGGALSARPRPAGGAARRGKELEPKPGDTEAVAAWKQRMASDEGKEIYKERAATSETVNADLRCYRGLTQMAVRGVKKAKCGALWCALADNLLHFRRALLA